MKDTYAARKESAVDERLELAPEAKLNEIRLLDEYELSLAGGGDLTDGWP
jgi:hypothetical protein